ncbi:MAG TPA: cytochrome c oxidase assembly protein, partial [Acetobacteraceae bacterium]
MQRKLLTTRFGVPGLDRGDFAGLAGVVGVGGVLAWACGQHPGALPAWAPWEFSWVEYATAVLSLWWYGRGLARTHPTQRPSVWRQALFAAGVMASYAVLQTRFDYLAQHMFFLSRIQHLTTHHLGPFLIALSWPGEMLRRGMPEPVRRMVDRPAMARLGRTVQRPVIAAVLFAGLIVLWLVPAVQFRVMLDARLYAVMNWTMLADGVLFWVLILDPRARPPALMSFGGRLVLVMSVQMPQIMLGALISLAGRDLYPF